MNDVQAKPELDAAPTGDAVLPADMQRQVAEFVVTNPDYYAREFQKIGARAGFVWTFNLWAGDARGRSK